MSDIVKIAATAVAAAICCAVVKKQTPEVAVALALAAGAVILWKVVSSLEYVTDFLSELADTAGLSPAVLAPVIKVIGISIITHTAGELCRDAKEGGLASFLELAGTVTALVVTVPLAQAVLSTVSGLVSGGGG